jgi:hypothetical protein
MQAFAGGEPPQEVARPVTQGDARIGLGERFDHQKVAIGAGAAVDVEGWGGCGQVGILRLRVGEIPLIVSLGAGDVFSGAVRCGAVRCGGGSGWRGVRRPE